MFFVGRQRQPYQRKMQRCYAHDNHRRCIIENDDDNVNGVSNSSYGRRSWAYPAEPKQSPKSTVNATQ